MNAGPTSAAVAQLRRLLRLGFHAERVFNADGVLDAVYLSREFHGVREAVLVYPSFETVVYRARDTWDPRHPFRVERNAVEWCQHGDLVAVTIALLSLPEPRPIRTPDVPAAQDGRGRHHRLRRRR